MRLPVAALAVRVPMTRPRRESNQRLATVAPSTMAVKPVPSPTISPQVSHICQGAVMRVARTTPPTISSIAAVTMRWTP